MIKDERFQTYLDADISTAQAREFRNDERIWKWCRQFTLISPDEQVNWFNRIASDPTVKMFGVYTGARSFIGVCGLTSIDRVNQRAEFSLYIAPGLQGKGHGREALLLLLRHGFLNHNLNRIWGESFDGNPAQHMFEAIGMQKEGTLRSAYFRNGKFVDSHIWSMLRSEFHERYGNGFGAGGRSADSPDSIGNPRAGLINYPGGEAASRRIAPWRDQDARSGSYR